MTGLVFAAGVWLAAVTLVAWVYLFGPPNQRLKEISGGVDSDGEEMRQSVALVRETTVRQLQNLECPLEAALTAYQESRRKILPGSDDHRWGDKELVRWKKQQVAERGRSARQRNLYHLCVWEIVITLAFGIGGWCYYQTVPSQVRPAFKTPVSPMHSAHSPQP